MALSSAPLAQTASVTSTTSLSTRLGAMLIVYGMDAPVAAKFSKREKETRRGYCETQTVTIGHYSSVIVSVSNGQRLWYQLGSLR